MLWVFTSRLPLLILCRCLEGNSFQKMQITCDFSGDTTMIYATLIRTSFSCRNELLPTGSVASTVITMVSPLAVIHTPLIQSHNLVTIRKRLRISAAFKFVLPSCLSWHLWGSNWWCGCWGKITASKDMFCICPLSSSRHITLVFLADYAFMCQGWFHPLLSLPLSA